VWASPFAVVSAEDGDVILFLRLAGSLASGSVEQIHML
jgi:hypothetical protein